MRVDENLVTFPDTHYVGLVKRREVGGVEVILGFATPGLSERRTPSAITSFEKRKSTVNDWAKYKFDADGNITLHNWVREDGESVEKIEKVDINHLCHPFTMKNVLLDGFKIQSTAKRWGGHFSSKQTSWRVLDPRGFELEISSGNLAFIMDSVGISQGGVIPGKCIWGRLGSKNVLVPENSPSYTKSVKKETQIKKGYISLTELKRGDVVIVDDKERVYYGSVQLLTMSTPPYVSGFYKPFTNDTCFNVKQRYVFVDEKTQSMELEASAKITKIVRTCKPEKILTASDVAALVNAKIANGERLSMRYNAIAYVHSSKSFIEKMNKNAQLVNIQDLPAGKQLSAIESNWHGANPQIIFKDGTSKALHNVFFKDKISGAIFSFYTAHNKRSTCQTDGSTTWVSVDGQRSDEFTANFRQMREDAASFGERVYVSRGSYYHSYEESTCCSSKILDQFDVMIPQITFSNSVGGLSQELYKFYPL